MKDIFLSYDLVKQRNYQLLWDELERWKARRVLESVWEFTTDYSPSQLRDHFRQFIDADDRLLVMDVHDWAGRNLKTKPATAAA